MKDGSEKLGLARFTTIIKVLCPQAGFEIPRKAIGQQKLGEDDDSTDRP